MKGFWSDLASEIAEHWRESSAVERVIVVVAFPLYLLAFFLAEFFAPAD